jgi:alpha-L-rhamnosidase
MTKRQVGNRLIFVLFFAAGLFSSAIFAQSIRPVSLKCEYQEEPGGIDTKNPSLSWLLEASAPDLRGQKQTAYQVLVASSPEILADDRGDMWNSGWVKSDQNTQVLYAGKSIRSLDRCFWKVRVEDAAGHRSDWSPMARWEMGLLSRVDWKGNWIGRKQSPESGLKEESLGYCSAGESDAENVKWVQVDLGSVKAFDKVILHPALPMKYPTGQRTVSNPGFGFPVRYRIDVSSDPDFNKYKTIVDLSEADFPNPGQKEVAISCPGQKERYLRLTVTKLWDSQSGDHPFYFALGELQLVSMDEVISKHSTVMSFDSVEEFGWGKCQLTDGLDLADGWAQGHEAIMLRKETEISGKIRTATAFISGLLDPGFTDYTKRVLYESYDIKEYISSGTNCLGIVLGNGWYDQPTPDAWGFEMAPWIAPPKVLINLVIDFEDGTRSVIASDESWKVSTGPIVYNSVRSGETYDARLEKEGWYLPGYADNDWEPAIIVPSPGGKLVSQQMPPIRATRQISPVSVSEPAPGLYVFDMGVNMTGWARFEFTGDQGEGDTVSFFYNEHLNEDGTVRYGAHAWWHYAHYQTDQYICKGSGNEIFEPRFTYHGFQYVQVSGLKYKPDLGDLKGIWVHTDPEQAGTFECSNSDLNKVQELILRTQLNNLHSIPTDCPHREKIGWMGDALITMEEAIYNFDMVTFYTKWFHDMLDAQESDGHVPPIVPNPGWNWATSLKNPENVIPAFSDPWWGGGLIMAPWYLYVYYGDSRPIREGYEAMQAYLDWIGTRAKNYIFVANLADWVEPDMLSGGDITPREQIGTAAYFYFARLMSWYATFLDKPSDSEKYSALADAIHETYNQEFFDKESGLYDKDSQLAQAMPLLFQMVPPGMEKRVEDQLIHNIVEVHNSHLSTGFIGTPILFKLLTELGHADLAYAMATQEDQPGWFFMLRNGATSIWEVWDAIENINHSRNHPAFGSIGAWYFHSLAGIQPDPEGPGFRKILIKPEPVGDLKWARGSYLSSQGKIESNWKLENSRFTLKLTVPVNTSATVYIPGESIDSILEGESAASRSDQVSYLRKERDRYVFTVGSGSYKFTSKYHSP